MTDINYINNILNQGQLLSNASTGDYLTFQKQLVASRASLNNEQMNLESQESGYQSQRAVARANAASANLDLQRQYLQQDYSTYMGYFNASQAVQQQAAQTEINTYLSNARNFGNAALYNMSRGITATNANVGHALSYFSASEANANSGSARDIEFNMIDSGYQEGNQNYAAGIAKANDFISEASRTSMNAALSALSAQEQQSLMATRVQRAIAATYNQNGGDA